MSRPVALIAPNAELLSEYEAALAAGWSPSNVRDLSAGQLAAIRTDRRQFLHDLIDPQGTVLLADGRIVPRLPFHLFWISDGEFCGAINFRFRSGSEELPPHVEGHVGYSVVPWKRRRGYATTALALILPVAHAEGLRRITVTCDDDNVPSRKVIESAGGRLCGSNRHPDRPGHSRLLFQVSTGPVGQSST